MVSVMGLQGHTLDGHPTGRNAHGGVKDALDETLENPTPDSIILAVPNAIISYRTAILHCSFHNHGHKLGRTSTTSGGLGLIDTLSVAKRLLLVQNNQLQLLDRKIILRTNYR